MKFKQLPLIIMHISITTLADTQTWQRVAYDDAGVPDKQPHLIEGDNWRFDNPVTDDEVLRTCAFGERVEFGYADLNPKAQYKAKLRFYSDAPREVRIQPGDVNLKLETGKPVESEINLSATATLTLAVEKISGPNAVVSEVEILSTDPKPLAVLPDPQAIAPRLTPRPVSDEVIDLAGTWLFNGTNKITVPGEWVMQGFTVNPGTAAQYERAFTVPANWKGQRIKLRCDGVYSDATISINGTEAGKHVGGFTPFELDVTDLVRLGKENTITMAIINESLADRLACGSRYACHQLGGIPRKIRLFALPEVHVSALRVTTTFDKDFRDATLQLDTETTGDAMLALTLTSPDGNDVPLTPNRVAPGKVSIPVTAPLKWDNEHPNLYTLTVKLEQAGKVIETVKQRIGFRQVEVRNNQVFVNNMPVKLRGVCRHEVHPLRGRSLTPELWRKDAELYREGNCNFIRTSHYPPAEEFLEACDELGLLVELEAPFCWVGHGASDFYKSAPGGNDILNCLLQGNLETVAYSYNHPSVIIRSLANESSWSKAFAKVHAAVRQADPTRPCSFHDQCENGNNHGSVETAIANYHYPNLNPPAQFAAVAAKRPLQLGEYAHLNAYNRLELATDPGLRDLWGQYLRLSWDNMYAAQGCSGGSIWAAMDDTFYIGADLTVGYGTWGPLDGWRREKPEYWNMKKTYSPVRLDPFTVTGNTITIPIENRQHFSNVNEMRIAWKQGTKSGSVTADVAPGMKGVLQIPLHKSSTLELTFTDPRGFVADEFAIALTKTTGTDATPPGGAAVVPAAIDQATGLLTSTVTGPQLMVLPLNDAGETQMTGKTQVWTPFTAPCTGWKCEKVSGNTVEGQYDNAKGSYTYTFKPGGIVEIAYDFTVTKPVNPRQIGLVFTLPRNCEIFSWERVGYWDVYPDDHIARLKGTVKASEGFPATSVGPRTKPSHPWRLDNLPYGNNDFCSTKHNVKQATVLDTTGKGLVIDGAGKQHVRCWRDETGVHVLVADYSNGGSERFLRSLANMDDRPLKLGDKITGTVRLQIR